MTKNGVAILIMAVALPGVSLGAAFTDAGVNLTPGGRSIEFAIFDQSGSTVDLALANVHAGNATDVNVPEEPRVWFNLNNDGAFSNPEPIQTPGRITGLHAFIPGTDPSSFNPRDLLAAYQNTNSKGTVTGIEFAVLESNGDGTYTAQSAFHSATNRELGLVTMRDLDQDGDRDAVVAVREPEGATWVFENQGGDSGTADFSGSPVATLGSGSSETVDIVIRDLNGDGFPEIIEGNASGSDKGIAVWEHLTTTDSGGTTITEWNFQKTSQSPLQNSTTGMTLTDIDVTVFSLDGSAGSGPGMVAGYSSGSGQPGVRFWNASSSTPLDFSIDSQNLYACPLNGRSTTAVDLADVDADGDQDILAGTSCNDTELVVFANDGNNGFGAHEAMDVHDTNATPVALKTYLGLDLDSNQDAVMTFDDNTARVLLNTGAGISGGSGSSGGSSGGGGGGGTPGPILLAALLSVGLLRRTRTSSWKKA